jgi:16S rRNA processing protein RimM
VRGTLRVRALGAGRHLRKGKRPVVAGVRRRISAARQTPKGFLLDLDAGEVVGIVVETFETAAHEILVVREEEDRQDLYLPFTLEHVPDVDLGAGRILIRPPEG